MTKKRSKCLFVLFTILLVVGLLATCVHFTYPLAINGKHYTYTNFIENIRLGEDVGHSLRIVYRAELPEGEDATNYDALRDSTIDSLSTIVKKEGYKDVTVAEYGEDSILLTVGNFVSDEEMEQLNSMIGNPQPISFSTNSDGSEPFANREHIKNVEAKKYTPQGSSEVAYIVILEFKEEYIDMVANASSGKTVYIYLGEQQFAELDYSTGNIADGIIYLQSSTFESLADAETCAGQVRTGMLALELTSIESARITPTYGKGSNVYVAVIPFVFMIALFAFLIVKYKHMGWVACYNLLFFVVLGLFLLQSIPFVHINFAGIIAMMLCLLVSADSIMNIFEHTKKHYLNDTKLHIAFKVAQKECLIRTIISNGLVCLLGFACLFMPVMSVQSFGWVAFVLSFVSIFTTLVLMRLFIAMYLPFNNTNGKKLNFHKGGKNA